MGDLKKMINPLDEGNKKSALQRIADGSVNREALAENIRKCDYRSLPDIANAALEADDIIAFSEAMKRKPSKYEIYRAEQEFLAGMPEDYDYGDTVTGSIGLDLLEKGYKDELGKKALKRAVEVGDFKYLQSMISHEQYSAFTQKGVCEGIYKYEYDKRTQSAEYEEALSGIGAKQDELDAIDARIAAFDKKEGSLFGRLGNRIAGALGGGLKAELLTERAEKEADIAELMEKTQAGVPQLLDEKQVDNLQKVQHVHECNRLRSNADHEIAL